MDEFGYEEKKQLPLPLKATLKIANNEGKLAYSFELHPETYLFAISCFISV